MKSLVLAFSMFSRIPVPQADFTEANMGRTMAVFPLVGLALGLAVAGWVWLGHMLEFGQFLRAVGITLLPLALSGGIHADGLCDTVDALASHGDTATKQRILRDPHLGAFAAMALCGYCLLFFALAAELVLPWPRLACLVLALAVSRSVTGLAVLGFPPSPESTLARQFQRGAHGSRLLLWGWLLCLGMAMLLLDGLAGFVAFALPLALLWRWKGFASRQFGGMSGDLAGCLLMLCELLSLASLVLIPKILAKI